jgi:hypothetical protein
LSTVFSPSVLIGTQLDFTVWNSYHRTDVLLLKVVWVVLTGTEGGSAGGGWGFGLAAVDVKDAHGG